jgi:trimethylamine---corrinoid protein Co-methyltransferase
MPIDNSFEQWSAEGGRDQLQRANRRWKGLLETYERPPLDAAREEALLDYVARRKRSMPDELG